LVPHDKSSTLVKAREVKITTQAGEKKKKLGIERKIDKDLSAPLNSRYFY
jgi:hypothetical protein